jgi:hypothetical protein
MIGSRTMMHPASRMVLAVTDQRRSQAANLANTVSAVVFAATLMETS